MTPPQPSSPQSQSQQQPQPSPQPSTQSCFSVPRLRASLATLQQNEPEAALPFETIEHFPQLESTNTHLWQLVDQGAKPGTTIIAGKQTAGRGQWSRSWNSAIGGLYLSTLLAPHLPQAEQVQLTFACVWGIAAALRHHTIPVQVKWVNDLVLDDRKLGGILTETRIHAGLITQAVIGVGLNWRNPTPTTGISLGEFWQQQPQHSAFSLEMLAAIVLHGIASGYRLWQHQGLAIGTAHYEQLLYGRGQVITVDGIPLRLEGVTIDGRLRASWLTPIGTNNAAIRSVSFQPGEIRLGYGHFPDKRT